VGAHRFVAAPVPARLAGGRRHRGVHDLGPADPRDDRGARTELSPIIAAALSLVTVVALTPLFTDLPEAVLAALIIHAVSHLMKVGEMKRFRRLVPREFWLAMLTLLGVIVLDVLPALIIGVVIALLLLVYQASRPRVSMLGADPVVPGAFADIGRHDGIVPVPGVLIVRPDAPCSTPTPNWCAMPSSRRWGVPGPWCSSWTATTTSTSPAPSSSASWPTAWPPGTSRSAWPTYTARP